MVFSATVTVLGLLFILSLPYWLPGLIIRLRMYIFARINGEGTLHLPSSEHGADKFREVYSHNAVKGRSRGAVLSDLFWYWLAPGPEMHQEHLEEGPRYEKVSAFTRKVLAVPRRGIELLMEQSIREVFDTRDHPPCQLVRIRDMMMPLWADFYYRIVFEEPCTPEIRKIISDNANDVVTALKCCSLRHMGKREKLTRFLLDKIRAGQLPHEFPPGFTQLEQAYYLQGAFFNTAIVQMSEAMAHLIMTLAEHTGIQEKLASYPDDKEFYDHVITENLRLYPLFGIAHRITTADIEIGGIKVERNSVVCFNYPEYHKRDYDKADQFMPERWQRCPVKEANYLPFGIGSNRPCPAQGIALISMRYVLREILQRCEFVTSAEHSRSLPNRGPCLRLARNQSALTSRRKKMLLMRMKIVDQWENLYRSLSQLVFGTVMVIDARRLRLCERYFSNPDNGVSVETGR